MGCGLRARKSLHHGRYDKAIQNRLRRRPLLGIGHLQPSWSGRPTSKGPYQRRGGRGAPGLHKIVTKTDNVRDFYRACQIPPTILHKIQSVEDRVHRGISWASDVKELGTGHEQSYRAELHNIHQEAVSDACNTSQVREAISALLSDPPAINVVRRGQFLTADHGLNRFLALLISSFIEEQNVSKNGAHFLPYMKIVSLDPAPSSPHACLDFSVTGKIRANGYYEHVGPSGDEELVKHECLGKDHRVILETTFPSQAPSRSPELLFNVMIYGMDQMICLNSRNHLLLRSIARVTSGHTICQGRRSRGLIDQLDRAGRSRHLD